MSNSHASDLVEDQVLSGISFSGGARAAIAEFHADVGRLPTSNAEAGLHWSGVITNELVDSITVTNDGHIIITYGNQVHENLDGKTIELVPSPADGVMGWHCLSNEIHTDYLPSYCVGNPELPNPRHGAKDGPRLSVNDIASMTDTFDANQLRFERNYVGKKFLANMPFRNVRIELNLVKDSYQVEFGLGGLTSDVDCSVSTPSQLNVIADWDKGDLISVQGEVDGIFFGSIQLINCYFSKAPIR